MQHQLFHQPSLNGCLSCFQSLGTISHAGINNHIPFVYRRVYLLNGGSVVKNLPADAGGAGLIPGSGRSPVEGNSNPLQCACLGNPMDREAWRATVRGVKKKSDMTKYLLNTLPLLGLLGEGYTFATLLILPSYLLRGYTTLHVLSSLFPSASPADCYETF